MVVSVRPRAGRQAVWMAEGQIYVAVKAPPVEGRANAEVEEAVAEALKLPKSAVVVTSGQRSRMKTLAVDGLEVAEIRSRLS